MTDTAQTQATGQMLRVRRFLLASTTYAVGSLILGLCTAFGLLPVADLGWSVLTFAVINALFYTLFRTGLNLRFADPSLTLAQVCVAISSVACILVLGEHVHFVAVPFYSAIFVFAMLRLTPAEMVIAEGALLVTYGLAIGVRVSRFSGRLELRVEAINAAMVVLSSVWFAVAASYISSLRARLRESKQTIEALATRDALTDTWNRGHIDTLLQSEWQRKARTGGPLCVALADLDHFKQINDRFGHPAGDRVLRQFAQAMKAQLRSVDQLGRYGGEEFIVLLPGVAWPEASICCERLRAAVAGANLLGDAGERVTVSIGLAECGPDDSVERLVARADGALYEAKRAGRNRVTCAAP